MRLALLHTLLTVQPFLPIPKVGCENLAFTVCQTAYFLLIEKYAKSQPISKARISLYTLLDLNQHLRISTIRRLPIEL